MSEPGASSTLSPEDGTELVGLAVAAIAAQLVQCEPDCPPPASLALCRLGASFVTLESAGQLRGCVGTLDPVRPLYLDVQRNARRAMRDPRLPEVTEADWPRLD